MIVTRVRGMLEACTERQSAVLRGAVVWERTDVGPARILPDGCTDLIWTGEDLIVADPDTTAHLDAVGTERLVAVRFPPGVGPSVFRTPRPSCAIGATCHWRRSGPPATCDGSTSN